MRSKLGHPMGWVVLVVLIGGCLVVLRPFVSALLWAVILSFAGWPVYRQVLRWVGNRRTVAALLVTLATVMILLVPFLIIGATLADNVKELSGAMQRWLAQGPPSPPAWLAKVPVVGQQATAHWEGLAKDTAKLWNEARRFIEPVSSFLLKVGLAVGRGILELGFSIFISFFLFRDGVSVAERFTVMVERVGGEQGKRLLMLAGSTVRGVVYGILGTALVQAILAWIGFLLAGVPGSALLAFLTFVLSVVPLLGPALIWIPAALWLFQQGFTGWGIFMLVWGLGVNNIEHVIKPLLISKGSDMPFLLIFFGVLGGAMAFGFIGVFLGPTLLAVGFRLVEDWVAASPSGVVSEVLPEPQKQKPGTLATP